MCLLFTLARTWPVNVDGWMVRGYRWRDGECDRQCNETQMEEYFEFLYYNVFVLLRTQLCFFCFFPTYHLQVLVIGICDNIIINYLLLTHLGEGLGQMWSHQVLNVFAMSSKWNAKLFLNVACTNYEQTNMICYKPSFVLLINNQCCKWSREPFWCSYIFINSFSGHFTSYLSTG